MTSNKVIQMTSNFCLLPNGSVIAFDSRIMQSKICCSARLNDGFISGRNFKIIPTVISQAHKFDLRETHLTQETIERVLG